MKSRKSSGKPKRSDVRPVKDLSSRNDRDVKGGARDAASGLATGKRTHLPMTSV
jgi:hypothetical protein